jgi:RHS repeat-associated protein
VAVGINPDLFQLFASDVDAYGLQRRELYKAASETEPHGYTGQEEESDLGLYHYGARLYLPELGRFLQVDPAREFANPFSFSGNNPIIFIDPNGKKVWFFNRKLDLPKGLGWIGNHSIFVLEPDDFREFEPIKNLFIDVNGRKFITIAAHKVEINNGEYALRMVVNQKADVDSVMSLLGAKPLDDDHDPSDPVTVPRPSGKTDGEFIMEFFVAALSYNTNTQDNPIPYKLTPRRLDPPLEGTNCNGWAGSILSFFRIDLNYRKRNDLGIDQYFKLPEELFESPSQQGNNP